VLDDRGTVEVGKRADLLLLGDDPLTDIRNTRQITAVIAGGRFLARAELDAMLERVAARYRTAVRVSPQSYWCDP
jgi:cytosine/adenosine deaminase-related metal-dependent hydrolase